MGEPVFSDIEVSVVGAVHNDVSGVGQIQSARRYKVYRSDPGNGIHANDSLFCRHCIHHDTIEPVLERVVNAGAAVKVHIQYLCHKSVLVFGLDNAVAALRKVSAGILGRSLKRGIDLAIIGIYLSAAGRLILKNQKESPG